METVTISLETYESMKSEISTLREEVKKRTIVKIEKEPVDYSRIAYMFVGIVAIAFMYFMLLQSPF